MTATKLSAGILGFAVLLSACSGRIGQQGPSAQIVSTTTPVEAIAPESFVDTADRLPVAVAELNRSQLQTIAFAKSTPLDPQAVDIGLRAVAAHAFEVGLLGSELSATAAAQTDGESAAGQYASVARAMFALALEAQNLRDGAAGNPTNVASIIAEYGARYWNPSVTAEGSTGNPFLAHVANASALEPVKMLEGADADKVTSQIDASRDLRTWIAISDATMERSIAVPAQVDASIDPFDAATLEAMKESDGQRDAERAKQVISAHLDLLSAAPSQNPSGLSSFIPSASAAGPTKQKTFKMPTGFLPLDLYNFGKDNAPELKKTGEKFIPIFTKEMKGLATTAKNNVIEGTVKAAEPEVADFLKGAGVAIPTKNKTVPVTNSTAPVAITITVDEAADLTAADAQKRGYGEGEKAVSFTVTWTTANTGAFTISCNGQAVADGKQQSTVTLNWPMKLGANRIACVALGNGGAVLGSNAATVTLKEVANSSSGKGLAVSAASASAPAVTAFSSSAQGVSSATASSVNKSSAFSLPAKASSSAAARTSSVGSSAAAVASSAKPSGPADTSWIDPYVAGIEKDLLSRGYEEIAVAIVADDLRECLLDQVNKGKDQAAAKAACGVNIKKNASSAYTDTTDQSLPTVGITAALTETIAGGPKSAFATQVVLTADHKAKSVGGTIAGSTSWDGSYYCYNTEDSSEVYQTVGARYTSTYAAKVFGGMGEGGSFSVPIVVAGTTKFKLTGEFTHEDCGHLNGSDGVIDSYSGKGAISGTATMGSMWTINNHWVTDDGAITVNGTFAGGPGWVK